MNKIFLGFLICFASLQSATLSAQEFKVGLKGGINKTFGGQITGNSSGGLYSDATFNGNGEIGYHGGLWVQVNFGKFFIRPEVVYSSLTTRFDFPQGPSLYKVEEMSVPILFGYNIIGPLDIYAGGAYKNILSSDIQGNELSSPIVVQNTPLAAQAGIKAEFGSFGIDVRYDRSLSSAEKQNLDFQSGGIYTNINKAFFDDPRLNQLIVSITLKLWDSSNEGRRRRRGGSCYF
ncbi:MAG: hypothetical protein WCD31_14885 [Gillisia sp.]